MSTRFEKTLDRLQSLAPDYNRSAEAPVSLALIGGLALGAWGVVRATRDVDFLLDAGSRQRVNEFLQFLTSREMRCNSIRLQALFDESELRKIAIAMNILTELEAFLKRTG